MNRCPPYGNCGIEKTCSKLLPVPPKKMAPLHLKVSSYATAPRFMIVRLTRGGAQHTRPLLEKGETLNGFNLFL